MTVDNVASWETLLDPQEKTSYVELFRTADTEGKGVLLKDEAMEFFKKSNVPNNILGEASIFNNIYCRMMYTYLYHSSRYGKQPTETTRVSLPTKNSV